VIEGIKREWLPRELAAKAARPASIALTPSLLASLRPVMPVGEPLASMVWAAATLGVYALLRPSEILGSAQHRDRALRFDQIEFFETASSTQRVGLHPVGTDADDHALPDRYSISPGVTKTDQRAKKGGKIVAGAPAVEVLWRWCHLRQAIGSESPLLFACEGTASGRHNSDHSPQVRVRRVGLR
jgi:hypothetical protein